MATATDRIHTTGQSAELALLRLLRDRPHPTEYLAAAAKTRGIFLYDVTIVEVLGRLMAEGLVESEWVRGGNGLPQRHYRLTPAGDERLRRLDVGS
jgi:DNA-binding PadR family transcriptional regulator